MAAARFWLRWSARDLRARWVQVGAIALVLGVGTGVFAGLGSTSTWRRESNDLSFRALAMYDVRVALAEGGTVDQGRLLDALTRLPAELVDTAEERLLAPTQVDASVNGRTILVPGQFVGVDVGGGGPHVNGLHVEDGRSLDEADRGQPVAVLERHFAEFYDLPAEGALRVAGGRDVRYVGTGLSPEYFLVTTRSGNLLAEANFAAVFVSIETAQALADRPGQVNDLLVRFRPGVDRAGGRSQVERAVAEALPGVGATVTVREDDDAYRILYKDIAGDQKFWNVIAVLILAGAVVAAFNLVSRMVEAQRRQIGVGMALGAPPARLSLRPLVAGLQIAFLGVAFGVGVGMLLAEAMRALLSTMLPLPVWKTSLQPRFFLQAAVLGFVLPLVATVWPVWRAVRVAPVDALRTSHLAARGIRLATLARRLPLPRSTVARMPVRNVLRAPRRTVLTAVGIGAAMCALVATLGMIDSFLATLDRGEVETLRAAPDRMVVELDRFHPETGPSVRAISGSPAVGAAEPGLRLSGQLRANGTEVDALIDVLDMNGGMWRPTPVGQAGDLRDGLVITDKAAEDLGVAPGDQVVLRHPRRTGAAMGFAESELVVVALHPNPMRFVAYLDRSQAGPLLGLHGVTNLVSVRPAVGQGEDEVKRALFGVPGVASVQPVAATSKLFRKTIDEFVGVLRIVELFTLVLALLIAFNASSISADERARDHATMFAFGLRVRTVARMGMVEGLVTGLLGTVIGVLLGMGVIRWVVHVLFAETVPDFGPGRQPLERDTRRRLHGRGGGRRSCPAAHRSPHAPHGPAVDPPSDGVETFGPCRRLAAAPPSWCPAAPGYEGSRNGEPEQVRRSGRRRRYGGCRLGASSSPPAAGRGRDTRHHPPDSCARPRDRPNAGFRRGARAAPPASSPPCRPRSAQVPRAPSPVGLAGGCEGPPFVGCLDRPNEKRDHRPWSRSTRRMTMPVRSRCRQGVGGTQSNTGHKRGHVLVRRCRNRAEEQR